MAMRIQLLVLLILSLLTVCSALARGLEPVTCEGSYPRHLQGVCADDQESLFWSFTTRLVKTDRAGKIIKLVDVASHHGDLCFHQGQVFVAVNLGKFNDPKGNADSWVYVYDAGELSCVARHKTPEAFYGAGGIAFHDGKFLVVGGLPNGVNENYVYEYDTNFRFVQKHVLASGHTNLGIQTAAFADGSWWFGCYGGPKSDTARANPPILLKADAALQQTERFEFECSLGIVPLGGGRFLVARGGSLKDKGYIGRLVLAIADAKTGLKLLAE
jgi:hypothetical protein